LVDKKPKQLLHYIDNQMLNILIVQFSILWTDVLTIFEIFNEVLHEV